MFGPSARCRDVAHHRLAVDARWAGLPSGGTLKRAFVVFESRRMPLPVLQPSVYASCFRRLSLLISFAGLPLLLTGCLVGLEKPNAALDVPDVVPFKYVLAAEKFASVVVLIPKPELDTPVTRITPVAALAVKFELDTSTPT